MKKTGLFMVLFFLVSVNFIFAGGGQSATPSGGGSFDPSKFTIKFTNGAPGGAVVPVAAMMNDHVEKTFPGVRTSVTNGGAVANLHLVGSEEFNFGHSSSALAFGAYNGMDPFKEPLKNLRNICAISMDSYQVIVDKNFRFSSLDEMFAAKHPVKMATITKGTEAELITQRLLAEYGHTYDTIAAMGGRVEFVSINDAISLFRDNHIEALFFMNPIPSPALTEVDLLRPLRALGVPKDKLQALMDKYGYSAYNAKANELYKGQTADISSVASLIVIICNTTVPDEVVYEITKFFTSTEGKNKINAANAIYGKYVLGGNDNLILSKAIPYHSGAKKYYAEIGLKVE